MAENLNYKAVPGISQRFLPTVQRTERRIVMATCPLLAVMCMTLTHTLQAQPMSDASGHLFLLILLKYVEVTQRKRLLLFIFSVSYAFIYDHAQYLIRKFLIM